MIEQNGSGLRVSGSMLIADAPALLTAGRGFLRTLPTGGDEVVFDLAAVTEADSSAVAVMLDWVRNAGLSRSTPKFAHIPVGVRSLMELYGVTDLLPQV